MTYALVSQLARPAPIAICALLPSTRYDFAPTFSVLLI